MNPRTTLPVLLALGMLAIVWAQTSDALKRSGTWSGPRTRVAPAADPYASLDRVLAQPDTGMRVAGLRDPFEFGRGPVVATRPAVSRPTTPVAPARPVVTAIVTDGQDSHAIVRYEGASYSVKAGDLFAQYRVVSISADQVIVEDGRERLVLNRPTKGD